MSVKREDLFWVRLPLIDVRQQSPEDQGVFREFDLYLIRGQAEYLIYLAKELEATLNATPAAADAADAGEGRDERA